jgi:ribosomal protein L40E
MEILFPILVISFSVWFWNFRTQKQRAELGLNSKIQCPECLAWIPKEAKKCMHCGSSLV